MPLRGEWRHGVQGGQRKGVAPHERSHSPSALMCTCLWVSEDTGYDSVGPAGLGIYIFKGLPGDLMLGSFLRASGVIP